MHTGRREKLKQAMWWLLINTVWLLPMLYGVKCLLFRSGHWIGTRRASRYDRWQYDLVSVDGEAAVWAGLGHVAAAGFLCLTMYSKFDPERSGGWQLFCVPVRWGSLLAMIWFYYRAGHI